MNKSSLPERRDTPRCLQEGSLDLAEWSGARQLRGAPSLPRAPGTHLSGSRPPSRTGARLPGTAASLPIRHLPRRPALGAAGRLQASSPPDFFPPAKVSRKG